MIICLVIPALPAWMPDSQATARRTVNEIDPDSLMFMMNAFVYVLQGLRSVKLAQVTFN